MLLAAAARRVNQLESSAEQALDRLAALTRMLSQANELTGSHESDAAAAAALYAAAAAAPGPCSAPSTRSATGRPW
jgi:hypothetical protein